MHWRRSAFLCAPLLAAVLVAVLVLVAVATPYPEESPPDAGKCPDSGGGIMLEIWDGVGEGIPHTGMRIHHCHLTVPSETLWFFNGWSSSGCPRSWPVFRQELQRLEIERPAPWKRALYCIEVWPHFTGRMKLGRAVVLTAWLCLGLSAIGRRKDRATAPDGAARPR